jgi:DNA repair protein RecN (Recombination protein N)
MEERMRMLQSLKRRYGPALESVLEYANEIEEKIDCFESAAQIRTDLLQQEETLHGKLKACADKLSQARKEAALTLTDLLSQETRKLGFLKAEFQIEFDNDEEPGPNGQDRIQILFTANPGVPMRPLKDVASSGEIARIMLAAKTVLAEADSIPILIFDEIDANIGGETAGKVGKELQKLAQCKQVICISHSPMVASCGIQHFLVSKNSDGQNTRSAIAALSAQERVNEIARMLGSGDAAQKHAAALLQQMDQIS